MTAVAFSAASAAMLALLSSAPAHAQSTAAVRCSSAKLKVVARDTAARLKCYAEAAKRNAAVDGECLAAAASKQAQSFSNAEDRGGCLTSDDADDLSASTDAFASAGASVIPAGTSAESRACAHKKRRAAGKEARALLTCSARGALRFAAGDAICLAKARAIFDRLFAHAEASGGCEVEGDADSVETLVDAYVNDALTALVAVCGDSVAGPGEPCDGSSDADCPGNCSSGCACGGICGNAVMEAPGEECDDGNVTDGDGCSSACQMESPSGACAGMPASPGAALAAELIASGLDSPVHVAAPPLDPRRLFIVEQPGRILLVRDGALQPTPFLDISGKVLSGGERGLLSIAFDPAYEQNGRLFVNYTRKPDGDTVVARYQASTDDVADATSETVLFTIDQPFSNHNGGQIAFGADGYLYVGMGDGGSGGDPLEAAQDDTQMLGKMLRVDVAVSSSPYWAVPPSNPNPGAPGLRALIWAKGLRNPWRFSFDRANDDLYIGDVGQNSTEEIDYTPAPRAGALNYGWDVFEGAVCYEPAPDPVCPSPPIGFTFPLYTYSHAAGCSVTGGFVYRGCALPDLHGAYFYSDYCAGWIRTFDVVGGVAANQTDRSAELVSHGYGTGNTASFGEDARGELYIVNLDGSVWKLVPAS